MVSTVVAALAALASAACPIPSFVSHDGALRFSSSDLTPPGDAPALKRAFTTSLPFRGQFGVGFGIEEELRVEPLPGGALRVTVPGPCPACAGAIPEASPDALAEGVDAAARTLARSGASALAGEALAYARRLAADRAFREAEWETRREAWLAAARQEPADRLERLPIAARYRVVSLPSGYLRYTEGLEVQELDTAGRLRRVVNAAGLVREVHRDDAGRIVRVADRLGRGFSFELDPVGQVVRATANDGRTVSYGYDGAGRLVWTEDRDGRATLEWDDAGRVVRVACGDRVVSATYEPPAEGGRVLSLDDSEGARERYVYEGTAGGLFRGVRVHPLGATTGDGAEGAAGEHAAKGGSVTEPAARELRRYAFIEPLTQDGRRWTWQAIEEEYGDAKVTIYDDRTYQPLSISASGRVARYTYDAQGRLARREVEGEITTYSYAPNGKIARVRRRGGAEAGSPPLNLRFRYDASARLVAADGTDARVRLSYDARGRMASVVALRAGAERRVTMSYDDRDRPARLEVEGEGALVIEYDERGEVRMAGSGDRRVASAVTSAFQTLLDLIRPATLTPTPP